MRRVAVEILIVAVAAVAMAGLVLTGGNAIEPTEPTGFLARGAESPSNSAMTCFEAPLSSPHASERGGLVRLCQIDRTLHVAIRATGLVPGEVYAAWLGFSPDLAPCSASNCGSIDLPHQRSAGLLQRVIGALGPLTHALAFDTSIPDVQLAPGAEITLRLLRASGQSEAEATFIIRYPPTSRARLEPTNKCSLDGCST
jgi:hypothetical protein